MLTRGNGCAPAGGDAEGGVVLRNDVVVADCDGELLLWEEGGIGFQEFAGIDDAGHAVGRVWQRGMNCSEEDRAAGGCYLREQRGDVAGRAEGVFDDDAAGLSFGDGDGEDLVLAVALQIETASGECSYPANVLQIFCGMLYGKRSLT